ncbi:MAG: NAD(+)/NADH kinase [Acidimicrobiales bacterium]
MTRRLGLVMHRHRPEVQDLARRAIEWCGAEIVACLPVDDAKLIDRPDLAVAEDDFPSGLDMCLSLGGDGTMLRSSQLVAERDVPILGVNAGRLGYLTEVDPDHMIEALERWKAGELSIEERMMVEVTAERPDGRTFHGLALNEAVVYRSESGRTLEVLTSIGGEPFTDYLADGVIVATPTGSTAYSLSAGGPIVEPDFHAILLTPIAAHMVFDRTMVLAPTTEVKLTVQGYRGAVLALDGKTVLDLEPGQSVVCRGSQRTAKLLVHGDRDFHTVLKEKFRLVDKECS